MSRVQRAIGAASMDAYARSIGLRDAAEYAECLRLHRRLDTGGRITPRDIEAAHKRGGITVEGLNQISDYVNAGASARDRADRYAACVSHGIERATGQSVNHEFVRGLARRQGESLEVREFAEPLVGKLDQRDAHRDRQNGIDEAKRVEAARRAALQNPDNQRRADIEREIDRHSGPRPTFYSRDRREILAQAGERNIERIVKSQVRDADPNRRPDRSDDRTADIALAYDCLMVEGAAEDELDLASNPLLEGIDNALTDKAASGDT